MNSRDRFRASGIARFIYGDHTTTVSRDDRGRMVAELWHTQSGKTIGITEVDTIHDGWLWAKKLADTLQPHLAATEDIQ